MPPMASTSSAGWCTSISAPISTPRSTFPESGATAEQIPVESLVVPLAVIDIRERAEENPDTELTPEDLRAWESRHGELPEGCCRRRQCRLGPPRHRAPLAQCGQGRNQALGGCSRRCCANATGRAPCCRSCRRCVVDRPPSLDRISDPPQRAAGRPMGPGGPSQPRQATRCWRDHRRRRARPADRAESSPWRSHTDLAQGESSSGSSSSRFWFLK